MNEKHDHEHHEHHGCEHSHAHGHTEDPARIKALLAYMLDHNREHAGELGEIAHALYHVGQDEAADILNAGVEDFEQGNEKLARALTLLAGERK